MCLLDNSKENQNNILGNTAEQCSFIHDHPSFHKINTTFRAVYSEARGRRPLASFSFAYEECNQEETAGLGQSEVHPHGSAPKAP